VGATARKQLSSQLRSESSSSSGTRTAALRGQLLDLTRSSTGSAPARQDCQRCLLDTMDALVAVIVAAATVAVITTIITTVAIIAVVVISSPLARLDPHGLALAARGARVERRLDSCGEQRRRGKTRGRPRRWPILRRHLALPDQT
jgi:hypothetical protein